MTKLLKVGVIGVGGIAHEHMAGWQNSNLTEVAIGSSQSDQSLQKWRRKFGNIRTTTNIEDILKDKSIDVVDICTPSYSHEELVIAALKSGKHVLCEKPLATTARGIRNIIKVRDEAEKQVMTAQHFRFQSQAIELKKAIDAGNLGEIYHSRIWFLRRCAYFGGQHYWKKRYSGGGACIDIGVHILDLALWFMGNPDPITVTGTTTNRLSSKNKVFSIWGDMEIPSDADVEEFGSAFLRFRNGASMTFEVSWLLHHDTGDKNMDCQVWLYGHKGGVQWPNNEIYLTDYEKKTNRQITVGSVEVKHNPYAMECIEFAKSIINHDPSPIPAENSLQVALIIDAIYRSSRLGKEIRI